MSMSVMSSFDPVVYEHCRSAYEKFRQEEGLPVKSMPGLVSPYEEVLGGVRQWALALRRVFASRKPDRQRRRHSAEQGAAAR